MRTLGERIVNFVWFLASAILIFAASLNDAIGHPLVAIPVLLGLQFVVAVIHELGHAWAASRCGARVEVICAVPFVWDASTRRVRFEP